MNPPISGIHHITAIASDPRRNLDFYTGVLGLRLVKKTVNFDDPGTYHFYYGDGQGHPGTVLTFFPWPGARRGRRGTGQVTIASFAIPVASVDYWLERLKRHQVIVSGPVQRFDDEAWSFQDPDGLDLEIVGCATADPRRIWEGGPVPGEFAIRGFHGATLSEEEYERTGGLLTETLGFQLIGESGNRFRYQIGEGMARSWIDLLCQPSMFRGQVAAGSVHHIAWRTDTEANQVAWQELLIKLGFNVSPVMDRQYFRSIYFREPGGVLFEVATDSPGFTVDEPVETLGTRLCLPQWLEPTRAQIEQILPPLLAAAGR
jgi:catechol 2,3-dioxygenase-like lactoylglutathione lyase family enzyme